MQNELGHDKQQSISSSVLLKTDIQVKFPKYSTQIYISSRNYTEMYASIRQMTKSQLSKFTQCEPMCKFYKYEVLKIETDITKTGLGI